jgi:hypothetical protein
LRAALLVTVGLVAGLVLFAFILVGVDRATSETARDTDIDTMPPSTASSPATEPPSPSLPVGPARSPLSTDRPEDGQAASPLPDLPDTDDPDVYAAAVAEVLFGMDYANHSPDDYEAFFEAALWDEIVADARERIMATISQRIPTVDMWEQMRSIEQTAEFEVELVWEPRLGRQGREEQRWPDGMLLRNVSGTQTESWRAPDEETETSTRPLAVTLTITCLPPESPCRLVGIQPNVES